MYVAKGEGRKKVSCVRCVHRGESSGGGLKCCQSVNRYGLRSSAGLPSHTLRLESTGP